MPGGRPASVSAIMNMEKCRDFVALGSERAWRALQALLCEPVDDVLDCYKPLREG
jgi:hypothetical protein